MPRVRGVHRAQRRILSSHSPIPTPTTRPRRSTPKSSRLGASRWSSRPAGCSSPPTLAPVSRPPHSQGAQRLGMPIPSVRIVAKPIYVSAAFSRIGGPGVGRGSRPWSMFVRFVAKIYVSPPPRSLIGGPGMGRVARCNQLLPSVRIVAKPIYVSPLRLHVSALVRGQPAQR